MKQSWVYILKCNDDTYYTGVTSNLTLRILKHDSSFYENSYTSSRLPAELVYYCEFTDITVAIKMEKQIKKWSKAKKKHLLMVNMINCQIWQRKSLCRISIRF